MSCGCDPKFVEEAQTYTPYPGYCKTIQGYDGGFIQKHQDRYFLSQNSIKILGLLELPANVDCINLINFLS